MKATSIISKLQKNKIAFTIENRYNDFNKGIFFLINGVEFEADITTGISNGFINEKGTVYTSLKHILSKIK